MPPLPKFPFLRAGVDVYLGTNDEVTFVYLSSRKRLHLRCHPGLAVSLTWLRGRKTVSDIQAQFRKTYPDSGLDDQAVLDFLGYLHSKNLIVSEDWFEQFNLPPRYLQRVQRQLHFLMDIVDDPSRVEAIQSRIMRARVAIFGIGGVGGWIARELAMMGFRHFVLVDPDITDIADAARHAFADHARVGFPKVDVVADGLYAIDPEAEIAKAQVALNISTDLENLVPRVDLIINAADEPYIGYTSVKLSRYAVRHNLPLLVAGGFDAHLASFGEMIIPRKTPCADCYVRHFQTALADWKPIAHPVEDRRGGFGGWSPLSVISASAAALKVLNYFVDPELVYKGQRTEFLATDYSTQSFEVARDPNCRVCGDQ